MALASSARAESNAAAQMSTPMVSNFICFAVFQLDVTIFRIAPNLHCRNAAATHRLRNILHFLSRRRYAFRHKHGNYRRGASSPRADEKRPEAADHCGYGLPEHLPCGSMGLDGGTS